MTSQILRYVDFTKLQKPRYLENETSFSIQTKKIHSLHIKGYVMAKNSFVGEVTFKSAQTEAACFSQNRVSHKGLTCGGDNFVKITKTGAKQWGAWGTSQFFG